MSGFGFTTVNYHEVLGVTRSASMEDIKKAYRILFRTHHPDVSGAQAPDEKEASAARFDEVQQAYDWLLANHIPVEDKMPHWQQIIDEEREREAARIQRVVPILIDNTTPATLIYTTNCSDYPETHMHIQLEDARKLKGFLEGERLQRVVVMAGETELFTSESVVFSFFQQDLREYEKGWQAKAFKAQLAGFSYDMDCYKSKGLPVGRLLQLLAAAKTTISQFQSDWRRSTTAQEVRASLRAVQNEAQRISDGDILQLLVDGLVDGTISHRDVAHNHMVIEQIKVLSIRSAGFIDLFTEASLRSFYEQQLLGVESMFDLQSRRIQLRLEDYAPSDILAELDPAPETVTIRNGNRSTSYVVHYDFIEVDDESIDVGIITIPVSVYQKVAAEYGKLSQLPVLPHGIRLMLEVEQLGQRVAVGFDDDQLAKKVTKFVKAKARGQKMPESLKGGYGFSGFHEASQVPPWYKGPRIR